MKLVVTAVLCLIFASACVSTKTPGSNPVLNTQTSTTSDDLKKELRKTKWKMVSAYRKADIAEEIRLQQKILEITQELFGEKHQKYAIELDRLGTKYYYVEKYDEGIKLHNRALKIFKDTPGASDVNIARSLHALARHKLVLGDFDEAEEILKRALALVAAYRDSGPAKSRRQYWRINIELANLFRHLGRYDDAVAILDAHPMDSTWSLSSYAIFHLDRGYYREAEEYFKRAEKHNVQKKRFTKTSRASFLDNIGQLYIELGRLDAAQEALDNALKSRIDVYGEDHIATAETLFNLGRLKLAQNQLEDAEIFLERSKRALTKGRGTTVPVVAGPIHYMGSVRMAQGRYEDAVSFFRQALNQREQELGPNHPVVGRTLNGLAEAYIAQDRYEDAEPLLDRALSILKGAFGPRNRDVGEVLVNLASVYSHQGIAEKSLTFLEQGEDILANVQIAIDETKSREIIDNNSLMAKRQRDIIAIDFTVVNATSEDRSLIQNIETGVLRFTSGSQMLMEIRSRADVLKKIENHKSTRSKKLSKEEILKLLQASLSKNLKRSIIVPDDFIDKSLQPFCDQYLSYVYFPRVGIAAPGFKTLSIDVKNENGESAGVCKYSASDRKIISELTGQQIKPVLQLEQLDLGKLGKVSVAPLHVMRRFDSKKPVQEYLLLVPNVQLGVAGYLDYVNGAAKQLFAKSDGSIDFSFVVAKRDADALAFTPTGIRRMLSLQVNGDILSHAGIGMRVEGLNAKNKGQARKDPSALVYFDNETLRDFLNVKNKQKMKSYFAKGIYTDSKKYLKAFGEYAAEQMGLDKVKIISAVQISKAGKKVNIMLSVTYIKEDGIWRVLRPVVVPPEYQTAEMFFMPGSSSLTQ